MRIILTNKYDCGYDGFPENLEYGTQLLKRAADAGHHYTSFNMPLTCWEWRWWCSKVNKNICEVDERSCRKPMMRLL